MAKLVSGRVKRTPQVSISSERYDYLSLEEAEPNLGDPLVGPSSVEGNPFPGGIGYILVSSPNDIGKRYWTLPQNVSGIGVVTYTDYSGISSSVIGGTADIQTLVTSGIATINGITDTSSYNTGALVIGGGVGIGSSLYVRLNVNINEIPLGRIGIASDSFFIGRQSGWQNTTGDNNFFVGRRSGYNNTTGSNNIFLGNFAGYQNTEGNDNNFLGNFSGFDNEDGSFNNFIGKYSGYNNLDGSNNQFIGNNSGYDNEGGSKNIFIGNASGYSNRNGNNNIAIGNSCNLNGVNVDNHLAIGNENNYWIYGNDSYKVGIGTDSPEEKLHVNGAIRAEEGFISVGNTTPITISLIGNQLIFTAVGIGSTSFTLV